MTDLHKLQAAMNSGDVHGIAAELGYGIDRKPECPICGYELPNPHWHCDACEGPLPEKTFCTAPGCMAVLCKDCLPEHEKVHVSE